MFVKPTLAEHKNHIHILSLRWLNFGPTLAQHKKHILHIRNLRWPNIVPMLAQHKTNVGPTLAGPTLDYNLPMLAQCRANEQNDVGPTYVANVGPM